MVLVEVGVQPNTALRTQEGLETGVKGVGHSRELRRPATCALTAKAIVATYRNQGSGWLLLALLGTIGNRF